MAAQTIFWEGKPYVVLSRDEYNRLTTLAKTVKLPPLPEPDARGNYPAGGVRLRQYGAEGHPRPHGGGLCHRDLAKRADARVETLCRIETGKHTPSVPTIDKIDRALERAARGRQAGKRRKQ
jgi:hypothetical protein